MLTSEQKLELENKLGLMSNDGIDIACSIEDRIRALNGKMVQFSDYTYQKEEKRILKIIKAINSPQRLRILQLLRTGAQCACEIELILKLSQPTVSHHIQLLSNAGIISVESKRRWNLIRIENLDLVSEIVCELDRMNPNK